MKRIVKWILSSNKISILKTILINFKTLPFSQAIHFPIFIYSNTLLESIGHIQIDSDKISKGMIRIGRKNFFAGYKTQLINSGTLVFKGKFLIEAGTCINNCGTIVLDDDSRICENCKILIINRLEIGKCSQIAFETVIMDTDFHNVVNINTGEIKRAYDKIIIGSYNWFGNRCLIKKGVKTPDHVILSAYSMLNKDYSQVPNYSLMGGCPAKVIASGFRKIFNYNTNNEIVEYFEANPNQKKLILHDCHIDWDKYCLAEHGYLFF